MKGYTIQDELKRWREPYRIYGGQELSTVAQDKFDVNSTISETDEEDANIEAEKDEILLRPDGKLFKILGKPHHKGGTPLNVPEGSFIYSKFKPLAIDKESKELFNFKEGGSYTKDKNTPSKILQREIDIKHHNKLFKVMDSKFHDVLSKNSAEAMMQKNFSKLGQIAYLQEEVKGFPNGLPEFAIGTAPTGNPEQQENISEMNQYKRGGFTRLPMYQTAGGVRQRDGRNYNLTTSVPKGAVQSGYEEEDNKRRYYFDIDPTTGQNVQIPYGSSNKVRRGNISLNDYFTNPNFKTFNRLTQGAPDDVKRQIAETHFKTGKWPTQSWQNLQTPSTQGEYYYTEVEGDIPQSNNQIESDSVQGNNPTSSSYFQQNQDVKSQEEDILPYRPRVPFTRDQLMDQGWAAFQAANINKYYPLRRQYNFTEFTPQSINTQPFIDNIRSQGSSFMQNQRTLDPRLARGNNSYAMGQMLSSGNEALGQVFNQNVGINNQANQFNTQGRNAVNAQNIDAGSDYYDKVNMTDQNYDNERRFAQNQFVSLRNQQKSMNDAMQQKLATQPTMGTRDVWVNEKTGQQSFSEKPGWTKRKIAAPLFDRDTRTGDVYYTGAGSLDMASQSRTGQLNFQQLEQILNNPAYGLDARGRAFVMGQYLRNMMNPRLVQNFAPFTSN